MVRTCPTCGTPMNRLGPVDGYTVRRVVPRGTLVETEQRMLSIVYACPTCEHCEAGTTYVPDYETRARLRAQTLQVGR